MAFSAAAGLFVFIQFRALSATVPVAVAVRDLPAHAAVRAADVRALPWPVRWAPAGSLRGPEEAAGRFTLQPVAAGQPILKSMLSADPREGGVRAALEPGMQALAVPVADVPLPPVRVGDVVDLVYVRSRLEGPSVARLLVRGIEVVGLQEASAAFGQRAGVEAVIVAVRPDQAERIAYGLANGRVFVALDAYVPSAEPTAGVDERSLFQMEGWPSDGS
ncbi:MAG: Flp pilus assembly protein CpaB [Firmicutes bacterium]|nr:Flp pilus assembly protein CpaB [Bacillota bacterium]